MLAKGKGYISMEDFRKIFDLPEDAEIVNVDILDGNVVFKMLSAEEVEGKFSKVRSYSLMRKFKLNKDDDLYTGGTTTSLDSSRASSTYVDFNVNVNGDDVNKIADEIYKSINESIDKNIRKGWK